MTSPSSPFPDAQAEADFKAWLEECERAEYEAGCPECPSCGLIMRSEMKDGRHINDRTNGYYLRRCWPCGKTFAMVRGEMVEWIPQRDPL